MALRDHSIQLSPMGMRVLRFPLTRFIIAFSFLAVGGAVAIFLAEAIIRIMGGGLFPWYENALHVLFLCSSSFLVYWLYVELFEGRPLSELSMESFAQTGTGIIIGFLFVSLTIGMIALFGGYRVEGWNKANVLLPVFLMSVQAAITEEFLMRAISFRIIEDGIGTWWSIILTALIFGFLHIWNDNATVISSLSIALTAGVIFALLYALTRKLWIVIGVHFAWNFTLGGIYGAPVSGGAIDGLMKGRLVGPEWITGGAFGPEASIFIVLISIFITAYLVWRVIRDDKVVRPMWRRAA
ncbi:MAG: CPBP family intramembrane metalloprotease [Bacteroidales bacterium]|nr:CPBP family intramembrane metalloprotease [Bacteroidales bacterium]